MTYLHSLEVQDFRSLKSVRVSLGRLNVLVGPNGAGKSNLLEVIQFLGDTVRTDLVPAIMAHGGLDRLAFRGGGEERKTIRIKVTAEVTKYASPSAKDEYSLSFSRAGRIRTFITRYESFKFKRTRGRGRRITIRGRTYRVEDEAVPTRKATLNKESSGLSTLRRLGDMEGAPQVGELANLFETFRVFNVDVAKARRSSPLPGSAALESNASNLAGFLTYLVTEHASVFGLLQEDLCHIVPGVLGIELSLARKETNRVSVELREKAFDDPTHLSEASFGTVRALALLAMLHDPHPPKLTCVEEIDHGLHPYALDRIVERLREASRRTQFVIATHSPALVNRLKASELIVCERNPNTGASRIPAIDPNEVRRMEAASSDVRLGELWFSGALGGVP
ncbi:AAA family ATPase [Planctomycetota bacterium]